MQSEKTKREWKILKNKYKKIQNQMVNPFK